MNEKRKKENRDLLIGIGLIELLGLAGFIYDAGRVIKHGFDGRPTPFLITMVCVVCAVVLNRWRMTLKRTRRPEDITGFPP